MVRGADLPVKILFQTVSPWQIKAAMISSSSLLILIAEKTASPADLISYAT